MSVFSRPFSKRISLVAITIFAAVDLSWFYWQLRAGDSGVAWLMVDGQDKKPDIDVSMMLIRQEGIPTPPVESAAESDLEDSAEVIGVQVGDKFRAYRLDALAQGPATHIVNDVVDDIPVTVTYCNMADCARAYTGRKPGKPLNISQGGLYRAKRMLLRIGDDDTRYFQDDGTEYKPKDRAGTFPFAAYPFVRATWKKWKQSHPTTEIYTGHPPKKIVDAPAKAG